MAGRRANTAAAIIPEIRELHMQGCSAAAIHRELVKRPAFEGKVPIVRTIQRIIANLESQLNQPTDEDNQLWSISDSEPEEAKNILRSLASVLAQTKGQRKWISKAEGRWLAKIYGIVPGLDPSVAVHVAQLYREVERGATDSRAVKRLRQQREAMDAYLAFEVSENLPGGGYQSVADKGWVRPLPTAWSKAQANKSDVAGEPDAQEREAQPPPSESPEEEPKAGE